MKAQSSYNKRQSNIGIKKSRSGLQSSNGNSRSARTPFRSSEFRDAHFLSEIDALVVENYLRGTDSFRSLVSTLPGVYPVEVLCSLRRLKKAGRIPGLDVLAMELEAASRPALLEHSPHGARYVEHPLDFEWHFSTEGVRRIVEEIESLNLDRGAEILCIGCPNIYSFGNRNVKEYRFTLLDKNVHHDGVNGLTAGLDLLGQAAPKVNAALAVIDPPWYTEYYQLFIWAAAKSLRLGGRIILSYPPEGTRPAVRSERGMMLKWCSAHGLALERRIPNSLQYRSPFFEFNALRAQGVTNCPMNWRRGDLIILKKVKEARFAKPKHTLPSEEWEEIRVGHLRVKINRLKRCEGVVLSSVCAADILPSVSSRHELRRKANVVTSGNRFLRTDFPEALAASFSLLGNRNSLDLNASFLVSRHLPVFEKAKEIVSKESKEMLQYFRLTHEI